MRNNTINTKDIGFYDIIFKKVNKCNDSTGVCQNLNSKKLYKLGILLISKPFGIITPKDKISLFANTLKNRTGSNTSIIRKTYCFITNINT